jgi:DNA-binding MarR family transcriptional regulator
VPPDDIGEAAPLAKVLAHSGLLRRLGTAAMRGKEVAAFLDRTEQRAGQLLSELESLRLVERRKDPLDGRASLWSITREAADALLLLSQQPATSSAPGWIVGLRLGPTGKRILARGLLEELKPDHIYRVVGDFDFVAVARTGDASPDMLADLRRRLHEAATVEATHIGYMLGN